MIPKAEYVYKEVSHKKRPQHIQIAHVNLEESPSLGIRFGIFNIPTIYLMREGRFYEFPLRRLSSGGGDHFDHLIRFALQEYSSIASNNGRIPADVTSSLTKLWKLM
jgi:hypothetical protein